MFSAGRGGLAELPERLAEVIDLTVVQRQRLNQVGEIDEYGLHPIDLLVRRIDAYDRVWERC